jgi:hypothetical protein
MIFERLFTYYSCNNYDCCGRDDIVTWRVHYMSSSCEIWAISYVVFGDNLRLFDSFVGMVGGCETGIKWILSDFKVMVPLH